MIAFDLGRTVDLAAIEVWNYNEATLPGRGVKKMEIRGSATPDGPDAWSIPLGTFELAADRAARSERRPRLPRQLPSAARTSVT